MTALTQYNFDSHRVRVVMDESGSPWFPASDACRVLGMNYEKNGSGYYLEHIAEKHKRGLSSVLPQAPTNELPPHTTMISEAGLYQLILKSRKPEAVKFQEWVTDEVLPSIRKTGSYVHKTAKQEPELMVKTREVADEAIEKAVAQAFAQQLRPVVAELQAGVKSSVSELMSQFAPRRREVPQSVKETHRQFVTSRGFRCSCCDEVKNSWSEFNVDHYKSRQEPFLHATWGVCAPCNQSLKDAGFHKESEPAFLAYQKWMKSWGVKNAAIKSLDVQAPLFD